MRVFDWMRGVLVSWFLGRENWGRELWRLIDSTDGRKHLMYPLRPNIQTPILVSLELYRGT